MGLEKKSHVSPPIGLNPPSSSSSGQSHLVRPLRETTKLKWNMLLQGPQVPLRSPASGVSSQLPPVLTSVPTSHQISGDVPPIQTLEGVSERTVKTPQVIQALNPTVSSPDSSPNSSPPPTELANPVGRVDGSSMSGEGSGSGTAPPRQSVDLNEKSTISELGNFRSSFGFDWKVVGSPSPHSAALPHSGGDSPALSGPPPPSHSRERALSLLERTSGSSLLDDKGQAPLSAHPNGRSSFSPFDATVSDPRVAGDGPQDNALKTMSRRISSDLMARPSALGIEESVPRSSSPAFIHPQDLRRQSSVETGVDRSAAGWRSADMSPLYQHQLHPGNFSRLQSASAAIAVHPSGHPNMYNLSDYGAIGPSRHPRHHPIGTFSQAPHSAGPSLSSVPFTAYPGRRSSAPLRHPYPDPHASMGGLEEDFHGMSLQHQQPFYAAASGQYLGPNSVYPPYQAIHQYLQPSYPYSAAYQHNLLHHQQYLHHQPSSFAPPHFPSPPPPHSLVRQRSSIGGMHEQYYGPDYDASGDSTGIAHHSHLSSTSSLETTASFQLSSYRGPLYAVEFKAGRTEVFYVLEGPDGKPLFQVVSGDLVIVEADRGEDLGKVVTTVTVDRLRQLMSLSADTEDLDAAAVTVESEIASLLYAKEIIPKRIHRLASSADLKLLQAKAQEEAIAMVRCQSRIRQKQLPMEVVDAEYQWDRNKLTFYFQSDRRIDFRELVRDLFRIYKTRIWMCAVDKNRLMRIAETQRLDPPPVLSDDLVIYEDVDGAPGVVGASDVPCDLGQYSH